MDKSFYVYILASGHYETLYTGVTNLTFQNGCGSIKIRLLAGLLRNMVSINSYFMNSIPMLKAPF